MVGLILGPLSLTSCMSPGDAASPVDSVVGTWGSMADNEPHLSFEEGGTVTGSDGCNQLAGNWFEHQDGRIVTDDLLTTLMECEGVDTWLSGIALVDVEGDRLVVMDADGEEIGTLDRSRD